jgi:hypothetical protein
MNRLTVHLWKGAVRNLLERPAATQSCRRKTFTPSMPSNPTVETS